VPDEETMGELPRGEGLGVGVAPRPRCGRVSASNRKVSVHEQNYLTFRRTVELVSPA
jgi:hypothetical protein